MPTDPTYAPSTALNFAKSMVKGMPFAADASIAYAALDYITAIMWMAAPWRWSLGTVGPDSGTAVSQGITDITIADPADFLYIEKAYFVDSNGSPQKLSWLEPVSWLPSNATNALPGLPSQIAHISTNTFRIYPATPNGFNQQLFIFYKKQRPIITQANYTQAGVQVFPDEWYWVFQTGLLWLAYLYADDQRAGGATVDEKGAIQWTGMAGQFQAGLAQMRRSEPLLLSWPGTPKQHG